jgi:FkbM family methyltransferase
MSGREQAVEAAKSAVRAAMPAWLYAPLRARRVRRLIRGYAPRTVHHTYAGFPLTVHLRDPLGEGWYDRDWNEPAEITALRHGRLRRGAQVFDIGAHQGVVALILAGIVGPEGDVVAVEAEPHNAAVARDNVTVNAAGNVTILHAAGAAYEGTVSFTEGLNGVLANGSAPGSVGVPAVTVDALVDRFGPPDVVLIDVEGHEGHVLSGATRTIAAAATDFFVELHDASDLAAAGSTAEEVLAHFDGERFEVVVGVPQEAVAGDVVSRWHDVSANAHLAGRRCFVVARPRVPGRQSPQRNHANRNGSLSSP